jgi:hypothetical protein
MVLRVTFRRLVTNLIASAPAPGESTGGENFAMNKTALLSVAGALAGAVAMVQATVP